ncbi:MAG: VWA domain-containing protein [Pirellulales bacterium]
MPSLLHPSFAFGFTELPLLGWLGLAVAPLIIQWWSQRKRREVAWGAMRFLLAAERKQSRRVRWENALLTLLRTLILAGVAFAAAGPYLTSPSGVDAGHGSTWTVFVIDASYSMSTRDENGSAWDQSIRAIQDRVRTAAPGDGWSVVLLAEPSRILIGEPTRDGETLLKTLERTSPTAGRADLVSALRLAEEVFTARPPRSPSFTRRDVVVYSDMGETTWSAWDAPPTKAARSALLTQLEDGAAELVEVVRRRTTIWPSFHGPGPVDCRSRGAN